MIGKVFQIGAGLLLLVAAMLKLNEWIIGGAQISFPPIILVIGFQLELLVGGWLVSGFNRPKSCFAGSVLYSALACFNVKLLLNGSMDCGCLGNVEIAPITMLVIDLMIATMLFFRSKHLGSRKAKSEVTTNFDSAFWFSRIVFGFGFAIVAAATVWATGNLDRLNKFDIVVETQNVGEIHSGSSKVLTVNITNKSAKNIQVLGARDTCNVRFLDSFPISVNAGDSVRLNIPSPPRNNLEDSGGRFKCLLTAKRT